MALELIVLVLGITWLVIGLCPSWFHRPFMAVVLVILVLWLLSAVTGYGPPLVPLKRA